MVKNTIIIVNKFSLIFKNIFNGEKLNKNWAPYGFEARRDIIKKWSYF